MCRFVCWKRALLWNLGLKHGWRIAIFSSHEKNFILISTFVQGPSQMRLNKSCAYSVVIAGISQWNFQNSPKHKITISNALQVKSKFSARYGLFVQSLESWLLYSVINFITHTSADNEYLWTYDCWFMEFFFTLRGNWGGEFLALLFPAYTQTDLNWYTNE